MVRRCVTMRHRWTKALLQTLAQTDQKLSVRIQGPYAAPPSDVGQPDAVIVVAGRLKLSVGVGTSVMTML